MINALSAGCVNDGVTDNAPAINAAIASIGGSGDRIFFPGGGGKYRINSPITVNKPISFAGDGREASIIDLHFASGAGFVSSSAHVEFDDLQIDSSVTRSPGSPHIHATAGAGEDAFSLERVFLSNCASGVIADAGFFWLTDCQIDMLPNGLNTGVKTTANAGAYVDRCFINGIGLPWLTQQPFAGLDLSDCGNAVITNTQMLCTGMGVHLAPSANGQLCTSLFFSNVLADHCVIGWNFFPTNNQSVSVVTMNQCWGSSSVGCGLRMKTAAGGAISNVAINGSIFSGNGNTPSGRGADNGVQMEGNCSKISFAGGMIYDHPRAADMSIYSGVNGLTANGIQFGNSGFKSNVGVSIGGTATRVMITQNQFEQYFSSQIQNAASGAQIITAPNLT